MFITLDEIIPYHPPPPKPPSKPPRPFAPTSSPPGLPSAHFPLPLTHPLPLRPPSPAVQSANPRSGDEIETRSRIDSGGDGHTTGIFSNAFNVALAKFNLVRIEDLTADVDVYSNINNHQQNKFDSGVQVHDGSCMYATDNGDPNGDNMRLDSETSTAVPEGLGASAAAKIALHPSTPSSYKSEELTVPNHGQVEEDRRAVEDVETERPDVVGDSEKDEVPACTRPRTPTCHDGPDSQKDRHMCDTGSPTAVQHGIDFADIERTDSKSFVRRALYIVFAAVTASCILLETFELCAGFLREIVGPDMLKLPELCSN
ncbi:hypothetical protein VTN77DRAFT_344 [Rasamsonia byssochlamydoides]|uniref:uncharacterized protein n=1 Tax=Rasamsonia byssochlamydoides TaxID=89139 RepID=UPI0037445291